VNIKCAKYVDVITKFCSKAIGIKCIKLFKYKRAGQNNVMMQMPNQIYVWLRMCREIKD